MLSTFGWVLFGMAIWGLCILMSALQRRFAPEMGDDGEDWNLQGRRKPAARDRRHAEELAVRDQELAQLRKRIETLETIVTDRRYQWEQELDRS